MQILVCLKPVPEPGTVKVDPQTHTLRREGSRLILNPPDRFALEAAVRLKESTNGRLVAVSMGPPNAKEILIEALACGADEAFLLSDRAFAGADTLATSYVLSLAAQKLGPFALIVCGKVSVDGETAQVGPELAAWLGWPSVIWVKKVSLREDKLFLTRVTDEGEEDILARPPLVITIENESYDPRPPSIKRLLWARGTEIPSLTAADLGAKEEYLGLEGSPTQVLDVFTPRHEGEREVITGEAHEVVDTLVSHLKERGLI